MTALSPLLACLTLTGRLAGWARSITAPPLGPDLLDTMSDAMTRQAFLLDPLYDHDERTRQ